MDEFEQKTVRSITVRSIEDFLCEFPQKSAIQGIYKPILGFLAGGALVCFSFFLAELQFDTMFLLTLISGGLFCAVQFSSIMMNLFYRESEYNRAKFLAALEPFLINNPHLAARFQEVFLATRRGRVVLDALRQATSDLKSLHDEKNIVFNSPEAVLARMKQDKQNEKTAQELKNAEKEMTAYRIQSMISGEIPLTLSLHDKSHDTPCPSAYVELTDHVAIQNTPVTAQKTLRH